ncbi:hypothetical protein RCZ04_13360 [Capnocytophaga sp. HP1101]
MKKTLYLLCAALLFLGCENDDQLSDESVIIQNGEGTQVLNPQNDLDKFLDRNFAQPYNIQILYRFLEREIDRTYTYTPTRYDKAIEFANIFNYLFIEPYVKMTSRTFMKEHSFNTLILIGEPAFNPSGSKLVGLASAGVKIHLTEINHIERNNIYWLNENLLATLYHENAHTWHQARFYTTDYEKISAADYKKDRWGNEWDIYAKDYLPAGFITAYSSYDHDEDFVELLARYIVYYNASLDCNCATTNATLDTDGDGFDDSLYNAWKAKFSNYGSLTDSQGIAYESTSVWEEVLKQADVKIRPTEQYTGKQKIEQKMAIMKKYLIDEWHINLDELRAEIRSRYPYVAGKTFDGTPVTPIDFTKLNN